MAAPSGTDSPRAARTRWPLVLGGAVSKFGRSAPGESWRDRVRHVGQRALAQAGLEARDIDALVVATESDFLSLQVNPAAVVASELGLTGAAVMRVEGGGASGALALRAGVLHVLSGLHERVLVVGWDDAASHLDRAGVGLVYGLSFDAELDGFAGATAAVLYALSIQEHMAIHGTTAEQLAAVAVKNRGHAVHNPNAHVPLRSTITDVRASPMVAAPLTRLDASPLSDGAAAIVLAADRAAPANPNTPRVRVVASACAVDRARLGDRPARHAFDAKRAAAREAYRQAGIADPARDIDVAEVYDAFTSAEIQSVEALGFCPDGAGGPLSADGCFGRDGVLPVNLSGGLLGQGAAPGAVGISQAVAIARLLQGAYWPALQPSRSLRRGLADCHGGIATVCAVHLFEREE